ncbi:MAG: hypothetical protein OEO82_03165 [Gammaproteobacteria bacterium]|nr:hypothetical protein [Gammaproteobacteria bacterium]
MAGRLAASNRGLSSAAGIAGLLLALCAAPVLASSGIDVLCPEADEKRGLTAAEIAPPPLHATTSLTLRVSDHGVDTRTAAGDDLIESRLVAPAVESAEETQQSEVFDDPDPSRDDIPPTATHLPGVSATDQPRIRRQMFRTDI